jgi:PIN domain nuclease of toxin-antitoxin system
LRLLIDTHALIWWLGNSSRLSATARSAIANQANELFVSACVAYEIAYKQKSGRLPPLSQHLSRQLQREGIGVIPVSLEHALAAAALPGPHRDPWDRIMMAQATVEGLTVITVDPQFQRYSVPVLW